jgi:hypothetical protein
MWLLRNNNRRIHSQSEQDVGRLGLQIGGVRMKVSKQNIVENSNLCGRSHGSVIVKR